MRIRLARHVTDLRGAPIDKLDAFLLTLLVDALTLSELTEIAPCAEDETERRVQRLAGLGLVELVTSGSQLRHFFASQSIFDVADNAVTLRPLPAGLRAAPDSDGVVTLRPALGVPLELDLDDFGDPPLTGVRTRPVALAQPLAKLKIAQRKA